MADLRAGPRGAVPAHTGERIAGAFDQLGGFLGLTGAAF